MDRFVMLCGMCVGVGISAPDDIGVCNLRDASFDMEQRQSGMVFKYAGMDTCLGSDLHTSAHTDRRRTDRGSSCFMVVREDRTCGSNHRAFCGYFAFAGIALLSWTDRRMGTIAGYKRKIIAGEVGK